MLLDVNADLNLVDGKGNAYLHNAITGKHRSIAILLGEFEADVSKRNAYCETGASSLSSLKEQERQTSPALIISSGAQ